MIERRLYGHPRVSVLTPTIPGREQFLAENIRSVASQTLAAHEHLVLLDANHAGCAATVNELASQAASQYLFILADDDLMLPGCLEQLIRHAPADIVYSPPLVWGEDAVQFQGEPPNIPAPALIRRDLWRKLGGYNTGLRSVEDQEFWRRAEQHGVSFVREAEHPTWVYRFHGGNKSRG